MPAMPRQLPPAVERELLRVLGWRARPAPIDFYMAIRDVLVEEQMSDNGPRFSMADITALAASIADWCPHQSIRIVLFGSRVRGDHRDDSDVDVAIEIIDYGDEEAGEWWGSQDFAEFLEHPPNGLPGPLHVVREWEEEPEFWQTLVAAEPVHVYRNVTCVILPPTPPAVRAAQQAERARRRSGEGLAGS